MNEFLKRYKIKIKTLSPIYIGSGRSLLKKEYVYDRKKKKIHVLNLEKMYADMMKVGMAKEYEKFLLYSSENLHRWFQLMKIDKNKYKNWIQYTLDCSETEIGGRTTAIELFVKDKYGHPYIPGTSLKGAIRTALLGCELADELNPERYRNMIREDRNGIGKKFYLERTMKKIEKDIFVYEEYQENKFGKKEKNPVFVNNKMSSIRVSDSKSLDVKDLTICQKVDLKLRNQENRLNLLRECIKPGTEIEFDLTIDISNETYEVNEIMEAINVFFDICQTQSEKFETSGVMEEDVIYLGGGSGFLSKTVMYDVFEEKEAIKQTSQILKSFFNQGKFNHHHENDSKVGVSPRTKKCTYYAGKRYEFGLCNIQIQEI
ncbi:MAG: type III-A CRISPR-associated RAMP protein Csm5 [Anaerostipes sp.]|nr:type III-A CRISPR-associated RAMP protein Csm5 [Anaerostipes sp.]